MAPCNHNARGWRAPADTRQDEGGFRCVDCGLVLCTEIIQGDLRSPNGKRPRFGHVEFCDRVATLVADYNDRDGKAHVTHACGIHRRRIAIWNPRPFVQAPKEGITA